MQFARLGMDEVHAESLGDIARLIGFGAVVLDAVHLLQRHDIGIDLLEHARDAVRRTRPSMPWHL